MSTTRQVLNDEGAREFRRILEGPVPVEYIARIPREWLRAAIPAEPEAGVYLVGNELFARVAGDTEEDRWRYLGANSTDGVSYDLTWEEIWDRFGGDEVKVFQLVQAERPGSFTFPRRAATTRDGDSVEVTLAGRNVVASVSGYRVEFSAPETASLARWLIGALLNAR